MYCFQCVDYSASDVCDVGRKNRCDGGCQGRIRDVSIVEYICLGDEVLYNTKDHVFDIVGDYVWCCVD